MGQNVWKLENKMSRNGWNSNQFKISQQKCCDIDVTKLFSDDELCIGDTSRKFGGQTLTPRHTIDAILGIKNRDRNIDGKNCFCFSYSKGRFVKIFASFQKFSWLKMWGDSIFKNIGATALRLYMCSECNHLLFALKAVIIISRRLTIGEKVSFQ